MNVRTLILAILNFQDASGYEIRKLASDGPYSHFIDIGYGSIYPMLAKLEAEQLVTSRAEQSQGKPERKVYTITEAGKAEFLHAIMQPPGKDVFKSEFLLVAMTAEFGTQHSVSDAIEQRIAFLEGQLSVICEHSAECQHPGTRWVAAYGKHVLKSDLEYLIKNKQQLLEIAGSSLPSAAAAE
ncbi:PadR family transcriptional regulator [Salaquimonas pukyongi]|uniref:PadR family transcriptional regulator n=1 Tax=Salaquimonas pukyongi TaxID=2712698 RepID=UPI00096BC510|nr:PadR family transcriptional regulator [Salaquimonas pukyongi]